MPLGLGLVSLLLLWALFHRTETTAREELMVTYVGLTNDAAGRPMAQFNVTNQGTRRIRFGVGSAQVAGVLGDWPPPDDLGGGTGEWLEVAVSASQVISQPPPSARGRPWRVPLIYESDPPTWMGALDGILGRRWRRSRSQFTVSPPVAHLPSDPAQTLIGSPSDSAAVTESTHPR